MKNVRLYPYMTSKQFFNCEKMEIERFEALVVVPNDNLPASINNRLPLVLSKEEVGDILPFGYLYEFALVPEVLIKYPQLSPSLSEYVKVILLSTGISEIAQIFIDLSSVEDSSEKTGIRSIDEVTVRDICRSLMLASSLGLYKKEKVMSGLNKLRSMFNVNPCFESVIGMKKIDIYNETHEISSDEEEEEKEEGLSYSSDEEIVDSNIKDSNIKDSKREVDEIQEIIKPVVSKNKKLEKVSRELAEVLTRFGREKKRACERFVPVSPSLVEEIMNVYVMCIQRCHIEATSIITEMFKESPFLKPFLSFFIGYMIRHERETELEEQQIRYITSRVKDYFITKGLETEFRATRKLTHCSLSVMSTIQRMEYSAVCKEEHIDFYSPFIFSLHPTSRAINEILFLTIDVPSPSNIHDVVSSTERLEEYVGPYLHSLDLKKSYITGSSISAAMSSIGMRTGPFAPINDRSRDFELTYPNIHTKIEDDRYPLLRRVVGRLLRSIFSKLDVKPRHQTASMPYIPSIPSFPRMSSTNDRIFRQVETFGKFFITITWLSETLFTLTFTESFDDIDIFQDESEDERFEDHGTVNVILFKVTSGADVDICVECREDEFEEIAKDHYSKVAKEYPDTKMISCGNTRKIVATTRETMLKFREVEIYRVDPGTAITRMSSHHLPMARACYTNANANKLFQISSEKSRVDEKPEFYFTLSYIESIWGGSYGNYHYFASKKQLPQEVIFKYKKRGFFLESMLVGDPRSCLNRYTRMSPKWNSDVEGGEDFRAQMFGGEDRILQALTTGEFNIFWLLSKLTNEDLSKNVTFSVSPSQALISLGTSQ